jgi:hypothetical protein
MGPLAERHSDYKTELFFRLDWILILSLHTLLAEQQQQWRRFLPPHQNILIPSLFQFLS